MLKQSVEKKSKTQPIEGIKTKILIIIIISGAVLGSVAPFLHMLSPRTAKEKIILEDQYEKGEISLEFYKNQKKVLWQKYQFIGFKNFRRFLYAIGLPIALFMCSFVLIFFTRFSNDNFIKKGSFITGTAFQFTSIFFITWTIFPFESDKYDFNESTYYNLLMICSVLLSFGFYYMSKSLAYRKLEIRELISLTMFLRRSLFKKIDSQESKVDASIEKEKIDDKVYETLEKVAE